MANDNQASYFRIGLTVIAGVAAIIAVLIRIGGLGGNGDELFAETYYDKPVPGLTVGSPVSFRGVKIGEVRKVSFIGDEYDVEGADEHRIYILLALDPRRVGNGKASQAEMEAYVAQMVKEGLRATVAANAITGLSRIECDFAAPEEQPAGAIAWTPKYALVPPKVSLLESFSDSATKVMNQINRMDLNSFWSNVNASVESISAATMSTRHLVEGYQPEVERLLRNLEETTSSLKSFAEEIRLNPSSLIKGVQVDQLPETAP